MMAFEIEGAGKRIQAQSTLAKRSKRRLLVEQLP